MASTAPVTLLLVDDEPAVLRVTQRVLQRAGYAVLAAESGAAAVELSRQYDGRISALITDVEMPGMTGLELVEAIGAHRPALAVLFLSGHPSSEVRREAVGQLDVPFLQKPFTMEELTAKVRELLDAA